MSLSALPAGGFTKDAGGLPKSRRRAGLAEPPTRTYHGGMATDADHKPPAAPAWSVALVCLALMVGAAAVFLREVDRSDWLYYDDQHQVLSNPLVHDLTPAGIIETLDLRRPIYKATASYGHFGREGDGFPWERTDRVEEIKSHLGL